MSVIRFLVQVVRAIIGAFTGAKSSVQASLPAPTEPTPVQPEPTSTHAEGPPGEPQVTPPAPPATPSGPDPNRRGTFLITDIYPGDLGANPPYHVLPGLKMNGGHEMIGCIIKASQGLSWGAANEAWFKRGWQQIKAVGKERYGVDWFRGCYHFLTFKRDGAAQADYFLKLVEQAGGWDVGDIMPMVDAEEGGQGDWAGGEKLEAIKDPAKRKRLAAQVVECVSKFADRVKERTGQRVMLYGRGIMRDLDISDRMHCDGVANPAYTKSMPPMDRYGWPLSDVLLWQLCGDGVVYCPGFSGKTPGWGEEDYSVYIDGANKTDLVSFRRRVLAKSR